MKKNDELMNKDLSLRIPILHYLTDKSNLNEDQNKQTIDSYSHICSSIKLIQLLDYHISSDKAHSNSNEVYHLRNIKESLLNEIPHSIEWIKSNLSSLNIEKSSDDEPLWLSKFESSKFSISTNSYDSLSIRKEKESGSSSIHERPLNEEVKGSMEIMNDREYEDEGKTPFITGTEKYLIDIQNKGRIGGKSFTSACSSLIKGGLKRKFVTPLKDKETEQHGDIAMEGSLSSVPSYIRTALGFRSKLASDVRLKNIDQKIIDTITNEIIDRSPQVKWDDIIGLKFAKQTVQETIIWPMIRPDLFHGLREPAKGILLFGPPGTGKTMIGKAIASEAYATFFSVSAASLTSKWHGEGEKLVKALFGVASIHQPAVIFIDEIDSLLCQRSDTDFEASRRSKTEFLLNFDGLSSSKEEKILVVGATNRPQDLDEAARRRFVRRLYIPLPDHSARFELLKFLIRNELTSLTSEEIECIANRTEGFSCADVTSLCKDAALGKILNSYSYWKGPIRDLTGENMDIQNMNKNSVRAINFRDFEISFNHVKSSVSKNQLISYENWNAQYGCDVSDNDLKQ